MISLSIGIFVQQTILPNIKNQMVSLSIGIFVQQTILPYPKSQNGQSQYWQICSADYTTIP